MANTIVNPSIGDKIKIKTVKEEIEGILLESPDSSLILLKLKSGYNIGLKKEDIISIEVLEKNKEQSKNEKKQKTNSKLKNIDLIITGGTISSKLDPKTGAVSNLTSASELLEFYPELKTIANIRELKIPFMKSSENMNYLDWKEIAKLAEQSLNNKDCEGVIITHGTDTLHYTSAALSFFLRDLNKPVVLTYSQRSSDRASSDARMNLICSAKAAISDIAEVIIVGHATSNDNFCFAMYGTKVRKMHTSRRDAFKPINTKPLAKIFPDRDEIEKLSQHNLRNNSRKVSLDTAFTNKIALVKFYPGQSPDILDYYYSAGYEGLVIEASGLGHVPTDEVEHNWLAKLKKLTENGMIVCIAPQTLYGRLDEFVYSNARKLSKAGTIFLGDMLPETAFVKLGFVLGHKNWRGTKEKIKEKMLENISGELNNRLGKEFIEN